MLSNLPTELLQEVFSNLDIYELKNVRFTCRRNADAALRFLLAHLRVRFEIYGNSTWLNQRLDYLGMLSNCSVSSCIRTLELHTPFKAPWDSYYCPSRARCPQTIKTLLDTGIPQMTRLTHLDWKLSEGTTSGFANTLQLLAENSTIQTITIDNHADCLPTFPPIFLPFLRSVSFTGKYDARLASSICTPNPHLKSLSISASTYTEVDFSFLPVDSELENLTTMGPVLMTSLPSSRVKKLQSLCIEALSPAVTLWEDLAPVRVRKLKVPGVSSELLAYLASFGGLHSLEVTVSELQGDAFWSEVVPMHEETLECLVVSLSPEMHTSKGWCLTERDLEALRGCRELRKIGVCCEWNEDASQITSVLMDSIHCWHHLSSLTVSFMKPPVLCVDPTCTARKLQETLSHVSVGRGECMPTLSLGVDGVHYVVDDAKSDAWGLKCVSTEHYS